MAIKMKSKKVKEMLEDLHDLSVVAKRKSDDTISFEDVLSEIKSDKVSVLAKKALKEHKAEKTKKFGFDDLD
jgi:hypothetical protein